MYVRFERLQQCVRIVGILNRTIYELHVPILFRTKSLPPWYFFNHPYNIFATENFRSAAESKPAGTENSFCRRVSAKQI